MPVKRRPNFFIIGAQKSGTSALTRWLAEHPAVFMTFPQGTRSTTPTRPGVTPAATTWNLLPILPPRSRSMRLQQLLPTLRLCTGRQQKR